MNDVNKVSRKSDLAERGGKLAGRTARVCCPRCSPPIAHRSDQFRQDDGVWLKEWRLFQRAIFVLDRADCILYAKYGADQLRKPGDAAARPPVEFAAVA
jgi:hypothetical protein